MPAQPYSAESKDWLTRMSLNKKVHLEIYNRDRYDRVVSRVLVQLILYVQ